MVANFRQNCNFKIHFHVHFHFNLQVDDTTFDNLFCGNLRRRMWTFLERPGSSMQAKAFELSSTLFVAISVMGLSFGTIPEFQVGSRSVPSEISKLPPGHPLHASPKRNHRSSQWNCHDCRKGGGNACGASGLRVHREDMYSLFHSRVLSATIRRTPQVAIRAKAPQSRRSAGNRAILPGASPHTLRGRRQEAQRSEMGVFGGPNSEGPASYSNYQTGQILVGSPDVRHDSAAVAKAAAGLLTIQLGAFKSHLQMMTIVLLTGVVFFSTMIYFLEKDEEGTPFTSIPAAYWWCIGQFWKPFRCQT